MRINLTQHYPIVDIQENLVFANNGNLVLCYKADLPEVYSLSSTDFEDLHGSWFQALKSLPAGTVIHKQDVFQKLEYSAERLPNTTFLEKATHQHFKGREYISHQSYLFFVWPKNKGLNKSKYVNPFRGVPKGIPEKMTEAVESFMASVRDAVGFLNNSYKLDFAPIMEGEILSLTDTYFNGFNEGFDTDIVLNKDHAQIGNHYFDVLAVNNELCFGDAVSSSKTNDAFTSDDFIFHQGFIDGLGLPLNENHIVNQIIYLDDKHKWRKLLEKRLEELSKSSNFGTQNKVVHEKISSIVDQINQDDNARIVRGHLNVIFWSDHKADLGKIASRIKTEFKELDIVPYYPKGEERKHYLLNSYCCFASNFSDEDLYVTDLKHSLCLLINNTNYKSDTTGIIFNDRQA